MIAAAFVLLLTGSAATGWQTYVNANHVNAISGSDSLLFVGTNGGLVLVDPVSIRTVAHYVNTDGLPSNRCLAVALDTAGSCWVGTDGSGLAVLRPDSECLESYRQAEMPGRVYALVWDADRCLVGTDRGVYVIDSRGTPLDFSDDSLMHFNVTAHRELLSDRVLSLGVGEDYWIGTSLGVTRVARDFAHWQGFRQPFGDSVKAIDFWQHSPLIATERGVAVLDSSQFVPVFSLDTVRNVFDLLVKGTSIYLAADTGLFCADSLDSASFQLILSADCHAVWIGESIWAGLGGHPECGAGMRYRGTGQSWLPFFIEGLASSQLSSCSYNRVDGKFYVTHYLTYWRMREVTDILGNGSVYSRTDVLYNPIQVDCDSKGRVWYGHFTSEGGLSVYDPATGEWRTIQWGSSSGWNVIDALAIDRNDTKWVYNGEGVVIAIDSLDQQVQLDVPGLVPPPNGGFDFAFDSRGRTWLGLTVGLVKIDYAGTLHDETDDRYEIITAGLPSTEVRSVATDREGKVWAATPQGAASWSEGDVRVYSVQNSGILSNNVYRVRVDASSRVWFLCDNGLSIFDQVSGRWTSYTSQNSGLITNDQLLTKFYDVLEIDDEHGVAVIGTQRGLSVFDFGVPPDTSGQPAVNVFPNPCVLGLHDWVVISELPEQSTVEIRTLTGTLVAELEVDEGMRRAVWRPGSVAGGVYLVTIHCPQGTRIERVAIISR